ncbi:hypothetical protein [Micromonospora sp. WMMD975]|uniref:DUF6414 family protein n=1 Tax=Micromonospora sp. WMMD975 TaxID=3016087 RepID=UPI00249A9395|nr:hypothetical protein [Micromonospora sp. WMMD975]WFE34553.1 hypothetical protein O7613_03980 [Micromonospora sp. WMMD975]
MREFVYLDEVSVTSLLSSRLGKLPNEFTDTLTKASKEQRSSHFEGNWKALKTRVGSQRETTWTEDTKVVSKATIQATFKRLYREEKSSLVLRPILLEEPPKSSNAARRLLDNAAGGVADDVWVIPSQRLRRGRLADIEVEVQADPAFRVSVIISTFADLMREGKQLFADTDRSALDKAIELNGLLSKLMAGLVPLRCRVIDYEVVSIGGVDYLAHQRLLGQLDDAGRPPTKKLLLVGVAEESLFWKDIRRILFSKSRFRVLCRFDHDGLRSEWTAVKLADVLGEVVPEFMDEVNMLGSGMLEAFAEGAKRRQPVMEPRVRALCAFGDMLASCAGVELTEIDRRQVEQIASEMADLVVGVTESRKAFSSVAAYIATLGGREVDAAQVAELRVRARQEQGLGPGGSAMRVDTPPLALPARGDEKFMETEIVAIYW